MKCPKCGGSGWDVVHGFDCISCDGKGEITLTNEEWFCGLSTEEKAEFFDRLAYSLYTNQNRMTCEDDWLRWLKEKHEE